VRAVNLLPKDEGRKRRQPNAVVLVAVLGTVLVTAVMAGMFLNAASSVSAKQTELDSLQGELAQIPPPPPTPAGQSGIEAEKSKRVQLLGSALSQRVAWDRLLREISLVLPEDVWLETMNANAPDPSAATVAGAATPTGGFNITGFAYSHDGVARLLARLNLVPQLAKVKLNNSSFDRGPGRAGVVKFTIAAQLRQAGQA
jgi:Tfp pilus assembly protein PilN